MDEHSDPLDELRAMIEIHWPHNNPYWRDDPKKFGVVIDKFADAWQRERDELQAKLDASMPLPIDADGEVIRPGDMVCDKVHGTFPACEVGYLDDGRVKVYQNDHICAMASAVRHASKPETIKDVREDVSGNVCKYFGYGSRSTCDKCPADGSEDCGSVKAADLVERAYECGLKDGGDDARD